MFLRCVFTVCVLKESLSAINLLDNPSAIARIISTSLSVTDMPSQPIDLINELLDFISGAEVNTETILPQINF